MVCVARAASAAPPRMAGLWSRRDLRSGFHQSDRSSPAASRLGIGVTTALYRCEAMVVKYWNHMIVPVLALVWTLASSAAGSQAAPQAPGHYGCREWHECRQLALAAADRGDYETFHDLAWRAVQTGPPRDLALMYLLARAQALSGRSHDALVMLDRLAEMGVATDATINEDFNRTRQLPGWPDVKARIEGAPRPGSPPVAVTAA